MPVTPGSASKLNNITGVSQILEITTEELTTLATKVLPARLLVKLPSGQIALTDGIKTVAELTPLIDRTLTAAEKAALAAAYGTGTYVAAANGVVAHDSTGKIADSSLNVVSNGKIVESYLADYIDTTTHKVLLTALPDSVRAGITFVADIDARDAITSSDEAIRGLVWVADASDDASVTAGSAIYGWDSTNSAWVKIAEQESLDVDVDAIKCDYTNVQAAGAVMYDHTLQVNTPTATALVGLLEANAAP
jgi:hypothetical protein